MPDELVFRNIFVTVGTTEFDQLIKSICEPETLKLLRSELGCQRLVLQIGRGTYEPAIDQNRTVLPQVEFYRFKPSIREDLSEADLVISHAGSGTCLELLELGRRAVVVVNESLHDNHQLELAEQLYRDGYLLYCNIDKLHSTLLEVRLSEFRRWIPAESSNFAAWLDDYIGLSHQA